MRCCSGVAFGLRDSLEAAKSIGAASGRDQALRRRRQKPAVEKDYRQCHEYERKYLEFRKLYPALKGL